MDIFSKKVNLKTQDIDWDDIEKSILRAPQLFMQTIRDKKNDDPCNPKIEHTKSVLRNYEVLLNWVSRYVKETAHFMKCFKGITDSMNLIFDSEPTIMVKGAEVCEVLISRLADLENDVLSDINKFENRINKIANEVIKILKPIVKLLKEKSYFEIDVEKYFNEHKKLEQRKDLSSKEFKKMYDVQRKYEEALEKLKYINDHIEHELPVLLLINDRIATKLGIIIFEFVHDTQFKIYSSFENLQQYYSNSTGMNTQLYFEDLVCQFRKRWDEVNDKIESLSIIKFRKNQFDQLACKPEPFVCQARALYDFQGLKDDDLPFKKGEFVQILEKNDTGWWKAKLIDGSVGKVPFNYLEYL